MYSIRKYGEDNFRFEIIHELPIDEARAKEQWYIDNHYDEMYNVSRTAYNGGDLISYHPKRDEIIAQRTETIKGIYAAMAPEEREQRWAYVQGENNPMYGRTHTEEARQKISESKRGKEAWNKGIPLSEEQRARLSEIGSERTGEKNPFYGRQHSDETKKLLAEKLKGKPAPNKRAVLIDGIQYESLGQAAQTLGVVPATILHRIRSKNHKYDGYSYVG